MKLLRWLSAVVVAFVLAGTAPALAQDIPDEATRARIADFVDRCGAQEGELRAHEAPNEMLRTGRGMREFIAQPENRVVAETARQFIGTCSPIGFAPEVTRHRCGSIAAIIYSPGNSAGDVMRNPGRYLDPDSGLSEDQRQYVRIYLERCVPAYAAALDELSSDDSLADIQQEETGPTGSGPLHGSIAFSQDDDGAYAWGIAWSFDSSAGAEAEALGQCREYGGTRCAEAGWFQEACGALAIGDGNGYGTGWGATTGEAERDALAQCRVSNDDCRIEVARCAQSEQAGGAGQTDSEDTVVGREPADTSDDSCGWWLATVTYTWNEEGLQRGGLDTTEEKEGATRAEAESYAEATCSGFSSHPEFSLLLRSCVVGEAKCVQPSGPQAEEDQPAATSPEQLCGVSEYLVEMEASNRAGCRFCFDRRLKTFRPENLHWSGSCSNGVVDGTGTLTSTDSLQIYETAAAFSAGVPHGHWVAAIIWKEGHQLLGEEEGAYVEGRREGDWAFRGALCSNGPYSNDESVHVEYYDCE